MSRTELAPLLDVSLATVTHAVRELEKLGLIIESGERGTRGRAQKLLSINRDRAAVIGVSIFPDPDLVEGVRLVGVVSNLTAEARKVDRLFLRDDGPLNPLDVVDRVVGFVEELRGVAGNVPVVAAGIEVGGVVVDGVVVDAPHLKWRGIDLASAVRRDTGIHTIVENDANALAIGEYWFGSGRGRDSLAVVLVDQGVGAGLILEGELHRGATRTAGEIGHVPVTPELLGAPLDDDLTVGDLRARRASRPCSCGRRTGCAESYIGRQYIVAAHRQAVSSPKRDEWDLSRIVEAAESNDQLARRLVEEAARSLGLALVYLLETADPSLVVVRGNELVGSELFRRTVKSTLRGAMFPADPTVETRVDFRRTVRGDGARGAAAAALRDWVSDSTRVAKSLSRQPG